jgi:hypothetical protein
MPPIPLFNPQSVTMAKKRKQAAEAHPSEEPPQKKQNVDEDLPPGVHHYRALEEVPWDIQKYWQQGYSIFSKYDDGIWMTDGSWYEVTHESVAKYVTSPGFVCRFPDYEQHDRRACGRDSPHGQAVHLRCDVRRRGEHHRVRLVREMETSLRNRKGRSNTTMRAAQCQDLRSC